MKRLIVALLIYFPSLLFAQKSLKDSSITCSMIGFSYGMSIPGGDLSDRFGFNSIGEINYKLKLKNNWVFGFDAGYLFGNKVKEDGMLDSILTADGGLINQNGQYAIIRMFERGVQVNFNAGKLIPKFGPNPNCGFIITGGIGYLQHKIKLYDIGNTTMQLAGDYKKGYDRLTSGIAFNEFIGYLYLGNKKLVNFYGGFTFTQAFTKSRRSFDYDLMKPDTKNRVDLLSGFKFGWIIPIYRKAPPEFYYN